jgi:hypothetical protein
VVRVSFLPKVCFFSLLSSSMNLQDLNFQPGVGDQNAIRARFGEPVNHYPIHGLKEFFLLVSVRRCKYQLSDNSIEKILQATIGGSAADFRPQWISDRVYKFIVASKNVGFHVYNHRSYSCDQYKVFFHLWSNDGARWVSKCNTPNQQQLVWRCYKLTRK